MRSMVEGPAPPSKRPPPSRRLRADPPPRLRQGGDGAFDSGTDASDDLEKARREGASKPERGGGDEGAEKEDDEGGATLLLPERWAAVGDGWEKYRDVLTPVLERASGVMHDLWPSARDLLPGAAEEYAAERWLTPERALPVYLRDEKAWRRK